MTRHSAGRATYPGDVRHIVGEIKGSTTYGSYAVAISATYNHETDQTTVEFAHLTDEDREHAVSDEFGTAWLPTLEQTR